MEDYGVEGYVDQNDVEEGERPIFGPLAHMISDQCRLDLTQQLIRSNTYFGIDYYLECLEVIERNN